jgi:hypothetical protein
MVFKDCRQHILQTAVQCYKRNKLRLVCEEERGLNLVAEGGGDVQASS